MMSSMRHAVYSHTVKIHSQISWQTAVSSAETQRSTLRMLAFFCRVIILQKQAAILGRDVWKAYSEKHQNVPSYLDKRFWKTALFCITLSMQVCTSCPRLWLVTLGGTIQWHLQESRYVCTSFIINHVVGFFSGS